MGYSAASATPLTITNGNAALTKYNYNHLMWPVVAGAYEFIIYSDQGLGGGYSCVGTAFTNAYSDKGLAMPCPVFAPVTPPASAGQQTLNTTIVSGGGTTTLTLAAPATVTASGQNVYDDETEFLTSCVNDVISYQATSANNEYGCYIPAGNWRFNAMMPTGNVSTTNQEIRVRVAGRTTFSTLPWFIEESEYDVEGIGGGPGNGQFQSKAHVGITTDSTVAAGVVINGNAIEFSGFSLGAVYGHGIYVVSGAAIILWNDSASEVGGGAPLVLDNNILALDADYDEFYAGNTDGSLPAILMSGTPAYASAGGPYYFEHLVTYVHAFEISRPGGASQQAVNDITISNWLQENLSPADVGLITIDDGPNA
ncbi:MAG: hypothetical protein ACRD4Y_07920, partial [Candidatus Acidiferrales bacterium]